LLDTGVPAVSRPKQNKNIIIIIIISTSDTITIINQMI